MRIKTMETTVMIKVLSYLNTNEDLDVNSAHAHAEALAEPGAKLIWLDGDVYDKVAAKYDIEPLDHNGDISVVYVADSEPSMEGIAEALVANDPTAGLKKFAE